MRLLDRRVGRIGFAIGYLPVLAVLFALTVGSGRHRWQPTDPYAIFAFLALALWSICITAWRCHDYGKSFWSNFWTEQIPVVGPILGLWDLLSKPGDPGYNAYGPPARL